MIEVHKPSVSIHSSRMMADHDYACPVCLEEHAVYEVGLGWFAPCWNCQTRGWSVSRLKPWQRTLKRWREALR